MGALRHRWFLCESEKRGDKIGRSRAGQTSKRHVVVDGNGLPLGLHLAGGEVHDLKAAIPTLESIQVPRRNGRARSRPTAPRVHREISSHRWKVERFFAWLNGFRRLGIRFERHSDLYLGFLYFAAIIICLRRLLQ